MTKVYYTGFLLVQCFWDTTREDIRVPIQRLEYRFILDQVSDYLLANYGAEINKFFGSGYVTSDPKYKKMAIIHRLFGGELRRLADRLLPFWGQVACYERAFELADGNMLIFEKDTIPDYDLESETCEAGKPREVKLMVSTGVALGKNWQITFLHYKR